MNPFETTEITYKDVLLVDDNLLNQKIFSSCLLEYDFSFCICATQEEALFSLNNTDYGIVLFSLDCPKITNTQLANEMRAALNRNIPIIALTKNEIEEVASRCFTNGINACMSSPIGKIDLMGILTQFLPNEHFSELHV